jgi:predicted nucleic acid-binding protein
MDGAFVVDIAGRGAVAEEVDLLSVDEDAGRESVAEVDLPTAGRVGLNGRE